MKAILALDAGTTNVKPILVDRQGRVLARSSVPLSIDYPRSGWVEQSAETIWTPHKQYWLVVYRRGSNMRWSASAFPIKERPWWPGIETPASPLAPCIVWQCRRDLAKRES
jgi:glycerol kinase